MSLQTGLTIVQVVLVILLVTSILVQSRGASLGEIFGGSGTFYGSRRGSERTLFIITVVLAGLFVLLALVNLFI